MSDSGAPAYASRGVLLAKATSGHFRHFGPIIGSRSIFFYSARKGLGLVIYAYGDDGSDAKHERVTAVSIIAGYEESWQELEDQWTVRCGGIPFHATDCESDRGDYSGIPHDQNKALYADLTGILASGSVGASAITQNRPSLIT